MIKVTVNEQDRARALAVLQKGTRLGDEIGNELRRWATDHLDNDLYGMENYAPPPAGSKYIRTGRLGANWGLQRAGKAKVTFYNMTAYAGYVVGNGLGQKQAAIHAGRWWLARKRTEAAIPELERRISVRLRRVFQ